MPNENNDPVPTNESAELDESKLEEVSGGGIPPNSTIYYPPVTIDDPMQPYPYPDDPNGGIIFNPIHP